MCPAGFFLDKRKVKGNIMQHFRVVNRMVENKPAARLRLAASEIAMTITDTLFGARVFAAVRPERIVGDNRMHYLLDEATLWPRFGDNQYLINSGNELKRINTSRAYWESTINAGNGPWRERARFAWSINDKAFIRNDPADGARDLFDSVFYPVDSVISYHTGHSYVAVCENRYRRLIDDAPLLLGENAQRFYTRAKYAGVVCYVNGQKIVVKSAEGYVVKHRVIPGTVPAVSLGDHLKTGQPILKLGENWQHAEIAKLLAREWDNRIFYRRGNTPCVRASMVTRATLLCPSCLKQVDEVCPDCRTEKGPMVGIPTVRNFWMLGGGYGFKCEAPEESFPLLPRLEQMENVLKFHRIAERNKNKMDENLSEANVSEEQFCS
jgi:hypothetical protein